MNILIVGHREDENNLRIIQEGRKQGHTMTLANVLECDFNVDKKARIKIHSKDIKEKKYDIALFRNVISHLVSEYLILANALFKANTIVLDTKLINTPFIWSKMQNLMLTNSSGLPTPQSVQITDENKLQEYTKDFSFPVVIKPVHGARGRDIALCDTIKDIEDHLEGSLSGAFMIQEYLDAPFDYRVMVIGGKAIGAVKKIPAKGEFRTNADFGSTFEKTELTDEMKKIAEASAKVIGLTVSGVDLRSHKGVMYILEVNRNPGFLHFEKATNINVAKHIIDMLESSHEKNQKKSHKEKQTVI